MEYVPQNLDQQDPQQLQQPDQEPVFAQPRPMIEPEQLYVSWRSASRPYKKRDREYYTTIGAIVLLLSIILFFAGQFLLIGVIISFAFVSYTLASVPPEEVEHAITTYGIRTGGKLYHWNELGRYWFSTKFGETVLNLEYKGKIISRLLILIGDLNEDEVKSLLSSYLVEERPYPTFIDQAAEWVQHKFPLDKTA